VAVTGRRESYVRPPLLAREPRPHWVGVWRFRLIIIVVTLLLAWAVLVITRHFVQTEQNPTTGIPGALAVATAPA